MDVPLKHIIGSVALIGLILAVGLSYQVIVSFVEADVMQTQLNQVAEIVSLNIGEMINLLEFGNFSKVGYQPMIKAIDLPPDLAGKAYFIRLSAADGKNEGYYVQAEFVTRKDIVARSPIPVNSTAAKLILVTSDGDFTVGQNRVMYSGIVYAGNSIVVWGTATYESTTVGIGRLISGGA